MTAGSPTFTVPFPQNSEVAHAYFSEAARHLQDARTLHDGARYAGSVTSAMKAVELSLKSLLILHSIRGWNDLITHKVMSQVIKSNGRVRPIFDDFLDTLNSRIPAIAADVEEMERLVPDKPALDKLALTFAENTEYPYFAEAGSPRTYKIYCPEFEFDATRSAKHFQTAYRLLDAFQQLSPEVAAWKIVLCSPL